MGSSRWQKVKFNVIKLIPFECFYKSFSWWVQWFQWFATVCHLLDVPHQKWNWVTRGSGCPLAQSLPSTKWDTHSRTSYIISTLQWFYTSRHAVFLLVIQHVIQLALDIGILFHMSLYGVAKQHYYVQKCGIVLYKSVIKCWLQLMLML